MLHSPGVKLPSLRGKLPCPGWKTDSAGGMLSFPGGKLVSYMPGMSVSGVSSILTQSTSFDYEYMLNKMSEF